MGCILDLEDVFKLGGGVLQKERSLKSPAIVADAQKIPIKQGSFDIVITRNSLEHVVDQKMLLFCCIKSMKSKGIFILEFDVTNFFANFKNMEKTRKRQMKMWSIKEHKRGGWMEPTENKISEIEQFLEDLKVRYEKLFWPITIPLIFKIFSKTQLRNIIYNKLAQRMITHPYLNYYLTQAATYFIRNI